ncbi:MAG: hypothetical protein ACXWK5_11220, partial [Myxococcaceae bacterium]
GARRLRDVAPSCVDRLGRILTPSGRAGGPGARTRRDHVLEQSKRRDLALNGVADVFGKT